MFHHHRRHQKSFIFPVLLSLFLFSCADNPVAPTGGIVSLTTVFSGGNQSGNVLKATVSPAGLLQVDSIVISRVRFVLEEVELESEVDTVEFDAGPVVLDLDLSNTPQEFAVTNAPFGTYNSVEFDIHRVDSSDLVGMSSVQTAPFADFLAGERYSIIIEGSVYSDGGGAVAFVFRSKIDAQQEYDLSPPIVVSDTTPVVNVTLEVNSAGWFEGPDGALLDPSDPNNQSMIDENLKMSIRVFEDSDRDGHDDI